MGIYQKGEIMSTSELEAMNDILKSNISDVGERQEIIENILDSIEDEENVYY